MKTKRSKRGLAALLALCMALFAVPFSANAAGAKATPALAVGDNHTVVLKDDGIVWAWGNNGSGQLGNSTKTNSTTPVQVTGLTDVTAVAAGGSHTVALRADGTVWAWGDNYYGQFGNGTNESSSIPVQVTGLSDVTAINAASGYTVALKEDGTVWVWGRNSYGQLGNGTIREDSNIPVRVTDLSGVTAIAAGGDHIVALKSDGTVWTWGNNTVLGDGTETVSSIPVQVTGLTNVIAIAAGMSHIVVLKEDGSVWAWGHNGYGQLGNGITVDRSNVPVAVDLSGAIAIAAGRYHTIALKEDGTVWAWGHNNYGQLGDGTETDTSIPVQASSLSGVAAIAAREDHTVALKSDSTVWTWGRNTNGQLGDDTTRDSSTPVQVLGENSVGVLNLKETTNRTTITATLPPPAYTVTIPTAIPVGDIHKTAASSIQSTSFDVTATDVANLGSQKVNVSVSTTDGQFNLSDGVHALPYKIYGAETGGVHLQTAVCSPASLPTVPLPDGWISTGRIRR